MATITINIPVDKEQYVIDGICAHFSYQTDIEDPENPGTLIPNPMTEQQFCKFLLIETMKNWVSEGQRKLDYEESMSIVRDIPIN